MRKINKRITALVLAVSLLFSGSIGVMASKISDAQKKQNNAQNDLKKINQSISKMEETRKQVQAQLNSLNADLVDILLSIQILEADIEAKKEEIAVAEAEYLRLKKLEEEQYAAMKQRMQTVYEDGNTDYTELIVELLVESESVSDFLNRVDFIRELSEYDDEKLREYQDTKEMVAHQKAELEEDKSELEEIQANEKEQKRQLDVKIAKAKSTMANADAELDRARNKAKEYQKTIKEQTALIKKLQDDAAKQAAVQKPSGSSSSSGDKKPSSGSSSSTGDSSSSGSASSGGGASASGSGTGLSLANFGLQFVGNPYVLGGTSLTNGTDCSGFTMSVHRNFGISIPRTSGAQAAGGRGVSFSELQAGDIVCYPGHVALYIGGGKVVHASSPKTGIKVSNYMYRTPICARRYW